MRVWAKIWRHSRLLKETIVEDYSEETRTHKVFHALEEVCRTFDLAQPMWLEQTVRDFQRHAKCRFTHDAFVEEVDFDYLEFQIIEEDY